MHSRAPRAKPAHPTGKEMSREQQSASFAFPNLSWLSPARTVHGARNSLPELLDWQIANSFSIELSSGFVHHRKARGVLRHHLVSANGFAADAEGPLRPSQYGKGIHPPPSQEQKYLFANAKCRHTLDNGMQVSDAPAERSDRE